MPIPLLSQIFYEGLYSVPFAPTILRFAPWALLVFVLRWYFGGSKNGNERVMHGKVIMVTGGTSGIGEALVHDLASRGAQIVLLVRSTHNQFLIDRINDLRESTNNQLIYAEECDLSSLHSIRLFATKWIDNAPPRRLDMVILCAGVMAPMFSPRTNTKDGIEEHWGINYLANFHLLNILSPALRAQPPDRDVRVAFTTCTSYVLGDLDLSDTQFIRRGYPSRSPWNVYGTSKLALMNFALEFQRRLHTYERGDKAPNNVRCYIVDPGMTRSPGTRRWLSFGSVWGLLVYLITWPFWFIVLKNTTEATQTHLTCAMSPECGTGEGGQLLRECTVAKYRKAEVVSAELAKSLWEISEKQIQELEKQGAIQRKKAKEQADKAKAKAEKEGVKKAPVAVEKGAAASTTKVTGSEEPPRAATPRSRTKKA